MQDSKWMMSGVVLLVGAIVAGGCQKVDSEAQMTQFAKIEKEEKEIQAKTTDKIVPRALYNYEPDPIPLSSQNSRESEIIQRLINNLASTMYDEVRWEVMGYGSRSVPLLIESLKRSERTSLKRETTRSFQHHDLGDACDRVLRQMVLSHSNYAGEKLPNRGDYAAWTLWWGMNKDTVLFYKPVMVKSPSEPDMATAFVIRKIFKD